MATAQQNLLISEAEYLAGERISDVKHEYIDGYVYAMSGAHANHNRISMNLSVAFANHLKGKSCQPYASDMKVKVGSKYFYPDVLVDCSDVNDYFTESPIILVEVLSKSTRRIDETTKRLIYLQIPTLQEYVLIEQDFVKIEIVRKNENWQPMRYYLGDEVTFESIGLTMMVEEIYQRVQNEEMIEWLASKAMG